MAQFFKTVLRIRRQDNQDPIHFKVDGGRFESEKTIKLNVTCNYELEFTFKPSRVLEVLDVQGTKINFVEKKCDEDQAVYTGQWTTTGMNKSVKGKRQEVQFTLQIQDTGTLTLKLQCKLYSASEKDHCRWGTPVNRIECECKIADGSSNVNVVKETYL